MISSTAFRSTEYTPSHQQSLQYILPTILSFNNTIFQPARIKLKRRCKRMTTNFHLHIAGICVSPGRVYNKFTHTHTQKAKNAQNNVEITYQQKNHVNLIVEILNCKIQHEYSVLPSCTRPGVFKHKLDFLNLFWLIDDFWFVLICKICGFYVLPTCAT